MFDPCPDILMLCCDNINMTLLWCSESEYYWVLNRSKKSARDHQTWTAWHTLGQYFSKQGTYINNKYLIIGKLIPLDLKSWSSFWSQVWSSMLYCYSPQLLNCISLKDSLSNIFCVDRLRGQDQLFLKRKKMRGKIDWQCCFPSPSLVRQI